KRTHLSLNGGEEFVFNREEVRSVVRRGNEIRQWVLTHDSRFRIAEEALQARFSLADRVRGTRKFRKEIGRLGNFPANVNRGNQVKAVPRESFGGFVLEVLHALVEAMHGLNRPGQSKMRTRFGDGPGGFAE